MRQARVLYLLFWLIEEYSIWWAEVKAKLASHGNRVNKLVNKQHRRHLFEISQRAGTFSFNNQRTQAKVVSIVHSFSSKSFLQIALVSYLALCNLIIYACFLVSNRIFIPILMFTIYKVLKPAATADVIWN